MSLSQSSAAVVAAAVAANDAAPADVGEDVTETTRRRSTACTPTPKAARARLPFSPLFSSSAAAAAAQARRSRAASLTTSTAVAATGVGDSSGARGVSRSPSPPTSWANTTRPAPKRSVSDGAGRSQAEPQPPPYEQPPQIAYGWWVPTPPPFGPYFWPCIPPGYALVPVSRSAVAGENDTGFLLSQETVSLKRSPDLGPQQESQNLAGGSGRASKCRRLDEPTTSRTISTASLGSMPTPSLSEFAPT